MKYLRIGIYNTISVFSLLGIISTLIIQWNTFMLDDELSVFLKVFAIIYYILVPVMMFFCVIIANKKVMKKYINSKLTYQAEGNGIHVDIQYDNGSVTSDWFEQLPHVTNENWITYWADSWLSGHFDDLGVKFTLDEVDYQSTEYTTSGKKKIIERFGIPERALVITFDYDVFGPELMIWMNRWLTNRSEKTNYNAFYKLSLDEKYHGCVFYQNESSAAKAEKVKQCIEQRYSTFERTEIIMFRENTMIIFDEDPGKLSISIPLFLTAAKLRTVTGKQRANIYKMCQLLVELSRFK